MENNKSAIHTYDAKQRLSLRALVALTRGAASMHRREYRTIREGGLTVSQFAVLEILYHKGPQKIRSIIEKTLSSGGNMTVVIDNLVREGFVERVSDPEDARACIVTLTEKGRERMETLFPVHLDNIVEIFSVLSDEEKLTLITLMKKLSRVGEAK
jgi:DNA-binding MarR family transcriptional regulator